MPDIEEWRDVLDAPGYKVSSLGRVMGIRQFRGRPSILAPGNSRGYLVVTFMVGGKRRSYRVQGLVCAAFNGPKPSPELMCAHRDGNKLNNTPGNLYWATAKENSADRERHGRSRRGPHKPESILLMSGENHWTKKAPEKIRRGKDFWRTGTRGLGALGERMGAAKLTEQQVREILAEPKVHGSGRKLAEKYGVSMGLITAIRKGRAWSYLDR